MGDLQRAALLRAELKDFLQLLRLARPLPAEECKRGVRGHHRALVRRQQVARVLGGEYQRAVVLPDAAGEADHEAANGHVFEQQAQLVDDQHAAAVLAFDPGPQRFCKKEVDRSDHLVAQLAHAEGHDGRLEVDIGRRAEHGAEASVNPAVEDDRDPRLSREAAGEVPEHRLIHLSKGLSHRGLNDGALGFVQPAAETRAEVDRVSRRGSEPSFVAAIGLSQIEDVERVARSERELDVHATELPCEAAVLVLGVDDEDLDVAAEGAHGQG